VAENVWQRATTTTRGPNGTLSRALMLVELAFSDVIGPRGFDAMLRHSLRRMSRSSSSTERDFAVEALTALFELSCTLFGADIASGLFAKAASTPLGPGMVKCR
jgi:hypothetical protein